MSRLDTLANALFGRTRAESQSVLTSATTRTYIGVATSDSADGVVEVTLAGDETLAEDTGATESYGHIQFATSPAVKKGDTVIVTLVGSGALKTPMVTGVAGSGDAQADATAAAQDAADAARSVADAINQYFWADSSGVHVSTEESDPEGTQNVLLNALGMLFRKGANNLLSVVTDNSPGVQIYDGAGNAASNIVANFMANLIELGKGSTSAVIKLCGGKGVIEHLSSGLYLRTENSKAWLRVKEDTLSGVDGSIAAIGATGDSSSTYLQLDAFGTGKALLACDEFSVTSSVQGDSSYRHIETASTSMTTPANDGADETVYFRLGQGYFPDTNYRIIITPTSSPNGYTQISYAVTAKTNNSVTIHSYNDYSSDITQTLDIIAIHD